VETLAPALPPIAPQVKTPQAAPETSKDDSKSRAETSMADKPKTSDVTQDVVQVPQLETDRAQSRAGKNVKFKDEQDSKQIQSKPPPGKQGTQSQQ
jgi:hypothetical protein